MRIRQAIKLKLQRTFYIGRALRLVWQSGSGWVVIRVSLLIVQSFLPLLSLYLMKLVVDAVETAMAVSAEEVHFRPILLLISLGCIVALVNVLCQSIAELINEAQAQLVTNYVYTLIHKKSIEVDLEYYENSQYYDALYLAREEAHFRPIRVLDNLVQFGQNSLSLLAIMGLLISFNWYITIILIIVGFPGILVSKKYASQMYYWQRKRTSTERKANYFDWMLTENEYAKEIRLFDLGSLFINRFRHLREQLYKESLTIAIAHSIKVFIANSFSTIAIFGSFTFIAYRTVQGAISLGDLVMYYQAFQRGQGFLKGVLNSLSSLYQNNLFLASFYDFLDLEPNVVEPLQPNIVPQPIQIGITFDRVKFKYPTGNKKILEDITLTVKADETIALVGENGAGKTTLVKLLCRFYDPTEGSIKLDGIELSRFDITDLRRQISVIFQDYVKFDLTAQENIWFGNINLKPNHSNIVTAASHSGADEVINKLPQGYQTMLGKWFEDGEELSIGQWQKIALARAFLRNAQIIILDEPSSALDAKAEHEMFQKFRQLVKGRTAILISHRLSTVKMADRIYFLEHGKIAESGTHDELMELGGKYAHLFETQAQHYR